MGAYITDLVLSQNYFETIFTRIPKKIADDIVAHLQAEGLPHVPVGNGGQGGPDRRGGDDGRARPASVKVRSASYSPRTACTLHDCSAISRARGVKLTLQGSRMSPAGNSGSENAQFLRLLSNLSRAGLAICCSRPARTKPCWHG
jgi:hypothetical protein